MNWKNIFTIAKKDWIEVRQNGSVLAVMVIIPLIFIVLMPLAIILIPSSSPEAANQMFNDPDLAGFMSRLPAFTMGSIVNVMPSTRGMPWPGRIS